MDNRIEIVYMTDDESRDFYRIQKPDGELSLQDLEAILKSEDCPEPMRTKELHVRDITPSGDTADIYLEDGNAGCIVIGNH